MVVPFGKCKTTEDLEKMIKESQEKETKQNKKEYDPRELRFIQLFRVGINFKERGATRLNNVIKVDTNDKDFVIIHQKNITSFYRRTDIEELHIKPQKKEQEV